MPSVHVVRKDDIAQHATLTLPPPLFSTLEGGCVRARTVIASLTSNNLSYAHLGTLLHWWDAFPVPAELPAPYNDQSQYGVVPVWGYAEVLDSRVVELSQGQLLWGFWPSHDGPVCLRLKRTRVEGHFVDITASRSGMASLYHRYIAVPSTFSMGKMSRKDLDLIAWEAIGTTADAGWAISQYIFGDLAVHPFGAKGTSPWTKDDADLSQAVVISMSGSGKTARGFASDAQHMRRPGTGPLGLLAITNSQDQTVIAGTEFDIRVVKYHNSTINATMMWIQGLLPKRIVILDFGARGLSLSSLLRALEQRVKDVPVTIIGIGNEMKVLSREEKMRDMKEVAGLANRIQMNASDVFDEAMRQLGEETFFKEKREGWESLVRNGGLDGLQLDWGIGVAGFHDGWQRMCDQNVPGNVGMAFRF